MPILETLAIIGAISGIASSVSGIVSDVGGAKASTAAGEVTSTTPDKGTAKTPMGTLAKVGAITGGISDIAGLASGLYAGIKGAEETEKAQKWNEMVYENQLLQQTIQNKRAQEALDINKDAQYFNRQTALRNEKRQNTSDWHNYMQNAANKYTDVLNRSRALRTSNAAALQNR